MICSDLLKWFEQINVALLLLTLSRDVVLVSLSLTLNKLGGLKVFIYKLLAGGKRLKGQNLEVF